MASFLGDVGLFRHSGLEKNPRRVGLLDLHQQLREPVDHSARERASEASATHSFIGLPGP
jgi:hypothetical protein